MWPNVSCLIVRWICCACVLMGHSLHCLSVRGLPSNLNYIPHRLPCFLKGLTECKTLWYKVMYTFDTRPAFFSYYCPLCASHHRAKSLLPLTLQSVCGRCCSSTEGGTSWARGASSFRQSIIRQSPETRGNSSSSSPGYVLVPCCPCLQLCTCHVAQLTDHCAMFLCHLVNRSLIPPYQHMTRREHGRTL